MLVSSNVIREEVQRQAGESIRRAQKKQQRNYESRNKSSLSNDIYISAEVLLRNNKRKDQKGRKFTFNWLAPYVVSNITKKSFGQIEEQK